MVASLLPPGKQTFVDINGFPLVGGLVYFYVPNTLILKSTWQNAIQTVLNTNPIVLDQRGQAVIYGSGTYRQILKDSVGNLIWDQPVSSSGSSGGGGGLTSNVTHAQSPYTLQLSDSVLLCDVSGGSIIINLLAATGYIGELTVKLKGTAANPVNIVANGIDTIDGQASYSLTFTNQAITLVSDGVSYWATI